MLSRVAQVATSRSWLSTWRGAVTRKQSTAAVQRSILPDYPVSAVSLTNLALYYNQYVVERAHLAL